MSAWVLVAALSGLAFWLRTVKLYHQVLEPGGFVNFIETDAWWHVRMMEHWARNFPFRLEVDPYGRIDGGQPVSTGMFFDLPLALAGWTLGLSGGELQQWAAWYPALLGTLLVPVAYWCGRSLFGNLAGLWAAAVVATLPGHFLHTGSLGYTDHHVMEALLTAALLWLLVRPERTPAVWLGAALTAYLLTFPGGAFVVALVAGWYWLETARGNPQDGRAFAIACMIAAPFALWQIKVYLMRYSFAAVVLTAAGLWVLPRLWAWCERQRYPRLVFAGISVAGALAAMAAVSRMLGGEESLGEVMARMTASNPLAPTVVELQSLTRVKGFFSLEYPWREFGGALVFSLTGLWLVGEAAWRRKEARQTLFALWCLMFFVMAMTQARMTYYFGVPAALLSGYLMGQLRPKSWAAVLMGAFLLVPNVARTATEAGVFSGQVTPDWKAALEYLREQTPEPFGDPGAFGGRPERAASYSVLAWWDYGYWIMAIGRRVPVTNPTQSHVHPAAHFFLARDDAEARAAMTEARASYVVVDQRLPFLGDQRGFQGVFLNLVAYAKRARAEDYLVDWCEAGGTRRIFLRAAYFRTTVVRLFLTGGRFQAAPDSGHFAVVEWKEGRVARQSPYNSLAAARAAAQCLGCEVVSLSPLTPCVDLDVVEAVEPVFDSPSFALRWQGNRRSEVQIYRVR